MLDFTPFTAADHGDALVLLLAVLAGDLVAGLVPGMARLVPHGGAVFSRAAAALERRLNRETRSRRNLVVRGALVVAILIAMGAAAGVALVVLARAVPYGWGIEAVALALCISGRNVFDTLRRGLAFAASEDLETGRALVSKLTGRDAARLDKFGLARVIVEMGAIGVSRRVVAPVLWYLLLGLPGLLASRAVGQVARTVRGRDREGRGFGAAALSLDHVLGLLPSWIAGYLLSFAAVVTPGARMGDALRVMSLQARRDAVVNDGRVKGAVAGALGLALGGPFGTGGGGAKDGWIGKGRARVGQNDIRRAFYLCVVAALLNIMAVAALTLVRLWA